MKKFIYIIGAMILSLGFAGCAEEELDPQSVIPEVSKQDWTEFDYWLDRYFRTPFNIRYVYKYKDIETDHGKDWTPTQEPLARVTAKIISYFWLEPYAEVGGIDFMRGNAPRVLQVLGCPGYNDNGTVTLGLAEGGLKVTIFDLNRLEDNGSVQIIFNNGVNDSDGYAVIPDMNALAEGFLSVMHHEFMHIICGKKLFPSEFDLISQGDYAAQWNTLSSEAAAKLGFVTNYASSAPGEDIAEVYSQYIAWSADEWQAKLTQAGATGAEKIERKLAIVKQYMKSSWGVDVDELKRSIDRRTVDCVYLEWDNFNVE